MKYTAAATRRNIDGKPDYTHLFKRADGVVIVFDTAEAALDYATSRCYDFAYAMYNPRSQTL